jgi:hypothetical protein
VAIHVSVRQLSWIASFLAMTAITRHCDQTGRASHLSLRAQRNNPPPRHCERSVAIHVFVRRLSWIASFLAMTESVCDG